MIFTLSCWIQLLDERSAKKIGNASIDPIEPRRLIGVKWRIESIISQIPRIFYVSFDFGLSLAYACWPCTTGRMTSAALRALWMGTPFSSTN